MTRVARALLLVPILVLGAAGCGSYVTRSTALTLATDRDVPLDRSRFVLVKRGVTGESAETVVMLFFGHRGFLALSDEAMRRALEQAGGDVLLDMAILERGSGFAPFYWTHNVTIRGDAYRLERIP